MFELARVFGEGPLLMSTIAERQALSRKHLHTLLTSLKSVGLVRSVRGPGGGFVLSRPPIQIKLSEVLRALEGSLSLVQCVEDIRACDRTKECPARGVWLKLSAAIEDVLDSVTLQDLVAQENKACSEPGTKKKEHGPRKRGGPTTKRSGIASCGPRTKAENR